MTIIEIPPFRSRVVEAHIGELQLRTARAWCESELRCFNRRSRSGLSKTAGHPRWHPRARVVFGHPLRNNWTSVRGLHCGASQDKRVPKIGLRQLEPTRRAKLPTGLSQLCKLQTHGGIRRTKCSRDGDPRSGAANPAYYRHNPC
jgi:hypothetical protein